jgi:hypothetical protein
MDGEDNN